MTEPPRDDPERDAWLRAALAHAPDAEVGAPAALSAAILRAAAERHTAPAPSAWQRLLDAWAWLARPPVAAGFASVMVATVVGLMWWDRPMDEAMPRPTAPAAADAAAPTGIANAPAAPASRAEAATPVRAADPKMADIPPDLLRQGQLQLPRQRADSEARMARPVSVPPAAPPSEPAAVAITGPAPEAPRLRLEAPMPSEPAQMPEALVLDAAPAEREMRVRRDLAAAAAPTQKAASMGRAELARRAAPAPLAPLLALLSNAAGDLRWQAPDGDAPRPVDAAAREWLAAVERATRGRWSLRAEPAGAAAEAAPAAQWWNGDERLGTLSFEPLGLAWRGADGRTLFAPLDAATLAALRAY